MADRHIVQGKHHIVQQEELLTRLRAQGQATDSAEALLALFNSTLAEHRAHRGAIAEALEAHGL